jgi:hypothetical protein
MSKFKTINALYILSLLIFIFILIGYFSIQKNEKAVITNSIEAIPLDASIIIESPNINQLIKNLENKQITSKLLKTNYLKKLQKLLKNIDTLLYSYPKLKQSFNNTNITISIHTIDNKNYILLADKIYPIKKQTQLLNSINNISKNDTSKTLIYSKTKIYHFNTSNYTYYYAIVENIFILSKSLELLQSAIRQKQSNNPISLDLGFKEITKLNSNSSHIYINYKHLNLFLNTFLNNKISNKTKKIKNIAFWSGCDISIQNNLISLNGLTFSNSTGENYLDMFYHAKPQKFEAQDLIPLKTAEFLFLATDNYPRLYSKYEKYISAKNLLGEHKNLLKNFKNKYKIKAEIQILPLIKNFMIFLKANFNNTLNDYSYFIILKTNNLKKFNNILFQINNNAKLPPNQYTIQTKLDNSKTIYIYKLDSKKLLNTLFGQFYHFPDLYYFTSYKDFIIFSNSPQNLKQYYNAIYQQKTLANNPDFQNFQTNILQRSNIFYFSNNSYNIFNILNSFNTKYKNIIQKNINYIKKIQYTSLQFSYDKKKTFTTAINLYYNNNPKLNGLTQWQTELLNNIKNKPLFFINHYTYQKEIFICDTKNIVYLINKYGKILWKKKINEDIKGTPYMLDLYNNSKYQIVFASSKHIITLDRNGKIVAEKTTKFQDSTKFGISVFDYSGNKNYRIFVPTSNNVLLFDKNMKKIKDWNPAKTLSPIVSKIYHFNYNNKDYIVYADKSTIHILNRRGKVRIKVKENLSLPNTAYFYFQKPTKNSKAYFITTDASGNIIYIDLKGNVYKKRIIKVSNKHTFTATDLNNDGKLDYIFTEANTLLVFNSNGKTIFTYSFAGNIKYPPQILKFSSTNIKIGIVIPSKSKVYIFNSDGTIYNNFPVQGNSIFSVGHLNNKNFNLIVGKNNYIYNYLIF